MSKECYSVYFIKKTEQSESTLRHSIFCGSLFITDSAIEAIIVVEFLIPLYPLPRDSRSITQTAIKPIRAIKTAIKNSRSTVAGRMG